MDDKNILTCHCVVDTRLQFIGGADSHRQVVRQSISAKLADAIVERYGVCLSVNRDRETQTDTFALSVAVLRPGEYSAMRAKERAQEDCIATLQQKVEQLNTRLNNQAKTIRNQRESLTKLQEINRQQAQSIHSCRTKAEKFDQLVKLNEQIEDLMDERDGILEGPTHYSGVGTASRLGAFVVQQVDPVHGRCGVNPADDHLR